MIATVLSIIIGLFAFYFGVPNSNLVLYTAVGVSFVLLSFSAASLLVAFLPLQKGEQNITPRLFDVYRKDFRIKIYAAFLFAIPLIMLGFSFLPYSFVLSVLAMGVGLDVLFLLIRRIMDYLNPFRVIKFMEEEAVYAIDNDKDSALCGMIESCAEIAMKSQERHNTALTNSAIDSLEKIGEKFLLASKSLSHPIQNPELKAEGVSDSISYVLLFLIQHLESIFKQSLDKKQEMTACHVVTTLAKLAIYTTRVDLSLTSLPLFYVDKLSIEGILRDFPDVGVKATIGLIEVAEAICRIKDIAYMDLKPSFITIISTLDLIAKETFKKDKTIRIPLLVHPFKLLNAMIEKEPIKDHQDKPVISDQLTHVMGEFIALESVMAAMPPMPSFLPEETQNEVKS